MDEILEKIQENVKNQIIFLKIQTTITCSGNQKPKKIFKVPYSTLDGFFNDDTHNSLRCIFRSVKIDDKKPI